MDHEEAGTLRIGVGHFEAAPSTRRYITEALDRGRLSYGPLSMRFEAEFARLHDRRFAIFCNSGTSALQAAVHALKGQRGWSDGDEVLVPAITFVASANVVLQNRLRPVFVDVDPVHYHLDPGLLAARVTPRTRAIMPVHLFGQPCDMDPIMDFAAAHKLAVIEDSCEAMFVRYRGRPVGSFGDIACFSTYVAHLITTGVGGLALTDQPELAMAVKSLFNHGRDGIYVSIDDDRTDDLGRLREIVSRRFSFVDVGYSYRGTELEAAVGLGELERWETNLEARRRHARVLSEGLARHRDRLRLPAVRPGCEHAFMMYPVVVLDRSLDRDELVLALEARGIETRPMLPLLNQPVYRQLFGDLEPGYPVAREINQRGFYIGCHPGLSGADLEHMVGAFDAYLGRA